jgi:23S rRNA pseudouridine2605 synthase
MAKSRSSQPRAQSSASGRRRAGSRAEPSSAKRPSAASKRATSKRATSKRATSKRAPSKPKPTPFAVNEREQREGVRLQKYIATTGVASRRKAEELIISGAVAVNGQRVTELGTRVFPGRDRVTVRGEPIRAEDKVYFVLNKPDEMVCSAAGSVDERGRPTVLSLMHGVPQRLYPVGRLDYHSRGVLILTNDGELAAALTHPRHGVVKTYHVKFQGKLSPEQEDALREGVELDDGAVTRPLAELFAFRETDANVWYQVGLTEGLNRQIRRMGDAIGHPVLKLIRVAIGDITADGLDEGEFRPLSPTEVGQLVAAVKLDAPASSKPRPPARRPPAGKPSSKKSRPRK